MREELVGRSWWEELQQEFSKDYIKDLRNFLVSRYQSKVTVYPRPSDIFRAFKLCELDKVKVIILGQDPYHNGSADGLSFSSQAYNRPKSLQVIFKEIDKQLFKSESPEEFNNNFKGHDLTCWAKQGVFLLNSCLTVEKGKPNSHKGKGWENLLNKVIDILVKSKEPKVFITWGKDATNLLEDKIPEDSSHIWLSSGHPATKFYGKDTFSGNNHFIECNKFLEKNNLEPINWKVIRNEEVIIN